MRSKSLDIRDEKIYADYQEWIAKGLEVWEVEGDLSRKYKLSQSMVHKIVKRLQEAKKEAK
jgi:Mor family transcriptional regulator